MADGKTDIPEWTDVDGNPLSAETLEELSDGKGDDE